MRSRGCRAFSLIELMVVIAIVALLAAVAVPSYKTYVIKSKIADAVRIMGNLNQIWTARYQATGVSPASIPFGSVTLVAGTSHLVNLGPIAYLRYDFSSSNVMRIMAQLKGLQGIPGYTEPATTATTTSEPVAGMIRMITYEKNGVFVVRCGSHDVNNAADIPLSYNPSNCQCATTSYPFNFGIGSDTCT